MIGSIFDSLLGQYRNTDKTILTFPSITDFPAIGSTSNWYVAQDTGGVYRWSSTTDQYVAISSAGGETINKGAFSTATQLRATYSVGSAGWIAVVLETQTYWYWDITANNWLDTTISAIVDEASEQSVSWIRRLLKLMSGLSIKDSGGRIRFTLDTGTVAISSGTVTAVTTVTTVTTLANLTNFGLRSADFMQVNISRNTYANNSRKLLSFS